MLFIGKKSKKSAPIKELTKIYILTI